MMYPMKDLLCMTQYQAYCTVKQMMNKFKKNTVRFKDEQYLILNHDEENPKPMLCIHVDTINTHCQDHEKLLVSLLQQQIQYNRKSKIYSLPNDCDNRIGCLGGDDRAGLWILLKLLNSDKSIYNYFSFGIFFDEEVGGKGSSAYKKDYPNYEKGVKCFIGLDRRGIDDVALYGYDNNDLINIFEKYGYKRASGSFTDASNLSNRLACINLSVGYDNEHTSYETLDMNGAIATYEILCEIAELDYITEDKYEADDDIYNDGWSYNWRNDLSYPEPVLCECCGTHAPLYQDDNYIVCSECVGLLTDMSYN